MKKLQLFFGLLFYALTSIHAEEKICFYDFIKTVQAYEENEENKREENYFSCYTAPDLQFLCIDLEIKKLKELAQEKNINADVFTSILKEQGTTETKEFENKLFSLLKKVTKEETNQAAVKTILAFKK
jgi:hypothetical protein